MRISENWNFKNTMSITKISVIWKMVESLWHEHPTPCLYMSGGSIGLTAWLQFAFFAGWG